MALENQHKFDFHTTFFHYFNQPKESELKLFLVIDNQTLKTSEKTACDLEIFELNRTKTVLVAVDSVPFYDTAKSKR